MRADRSDPPRRRGFAAAEGPNSSRVTAAKRMDAGRPLRARAGTVRVQGRSVWSQPPGARKGAAVGAAASSRVAAAERMDAGRPLRAGGRRPRPGPLRVEPAAGRADGGRRGRRCLLACGCSRARGCGPPPPRGRSPPASRAAPRGATRRQHGGHQAPPWGPLLLRRWPSSSAAGLLYTACLSLSCVGR